MSSDPTSWTQRGPNDARGERDLYRLSGPLVQAPGELRSPLYQARGSTSETRHLLWPLPPDIEIAAVLERARAVDALGHPAFPRLTDHGELPTTGPHAGQPQPFLVFEGETGCSLRQTIERHPMALPDAALLTGRVVEALDALHGAGLVHGSLSPATVYLTVRGEVRVLLAALEDPARYRDTREGRDRIGWAGAASLAPEQLPRELLPEDATFATAPPGPASDLWAVGALLQTSLTAEPAFYGRSFDAQARSIATLSPDPLGPAPGRTPVELDRLLERTLARSPAERYPDAASLRADLDRLAAALEPGDLRTAAGIVARGPRAAPSPPSNAVPRGGTRPGPEAPAGGALGWLEERRERLRSEPGPPVWLVLLPPLLLAALLVLVAWLYWTF